LAKDIILEIQIFCESERNKPKGSENLIRACPPPLAFQVS
jgi:hypothetical protein